jgi:monoamine oxidase
MDVKLFFCGTETAEEYSGYMEGALIAAQRVFDQITSVE